jgi:hypothetical protein
MNKLAKNDLAALTCHFVADRLESELFSKEERLLREVSYYTEATNDVKPLTAAERARVGRYLARIVWLVREGAESIADPEEPKRWWLVRICDPDMRSDDGLRVVCDYIMEADTRPDDSGVEAMLADGTEDYHDDWASHQEAMPSGVLVYGPSATAAEASKQMYAWEPPRENTGPAPYYGE